mmetsp:Transcript_42511/g.107262  ORF Transcript_42511/g.107262 Transcript_42511/m.107262 type:complete len:208 (+) Transcript_42511:308-931(+)
MNSALRAFFMVLLLSAKRPALDQTHNNQCETFLLLYRYIHDRRQLLPHHHHHHHRHQLLLLHLRTHIPMCRPRIHLMVVLETLWSLYCEFQWIASSLPPCTLSLCFWTQPSVPPSRSVTQCLPTRPTFSHLPRHSIMLSLSPKMPSTRPPACLWALLLRLQTLPPPPPPPSRQAPVPLRTPSVARHPPWCRPPLLCYPRACSRALAI